MKENLFVIFAPGLGGNHLSNLISLTPRFYSSCDLTRYRPGMKDAHFAQLGNLHPESIKKNYRDLCDKNNVLCGHIAEYLWLQNNQLDKLFENRKFLAVDFPNKESKAHRRMTSLCSWYLNDYIFYEHSTLYSQKYLKLLFNEHDFFHISSEDIFNKSVQGIEKFIYEDLGTEWDHDEAQRLHTLWFDNISG